MSFKPYVYLVFAGGVGSKASPFARALAAQTYIRPGPTRTKVPHARCEGEGSKGDGTILYRGVFQPSPETVTHPPWIRYCSYVFTVLSPYTRHPLRTAPLGTSQFQDSAIAPPAACAPTPRWRCGGAAFDGTDTLPEPDAQIAVGLIAQPQPGEFDHDGARLGIAGLADALVAIDRSAVKRARRVADITPQLAAIVEVAMEYLANQQLVANSGPIALSLASIWIFSALTCVDAHLLRMASRSASRVAIISSTSSRRCNSRMISDFSRGGSARPSPCAIAPAAPTVRPQRLVIVDALERAKPFDAVDMLNTFGDQAITLTMQPPGVFLFDAGHAHHAPHLRLAAQIRHQRAQQPLRVDPIRLYSSRPPVHLQACRINNVIAYAMGFSSRCNQKPS